MPPSLTNVGSHGAGFENHSVRTELHVLQLASRERHPFLLPMRECFQTAVRAAGAKERGGAIADRRRQPTWLLGPGRRPRRRAWSL